MSQSLEMLLRGKVLELDRVSDAWRTVQRQQQDGEDRQTRILRERDALLDQLQEALRARTQEVQVQNHFNVFETQTEPGRLQVRSADFKIRLKHFSNFFSFEAFILTVIFLSAAGAALLPAGSGPLCSQPSSGGAEAPPPD